ncbi:MAG: PACE efflux transporter [Amaricoccus sp.]|uniref:PACE efflux transporter n=1 Tax=Amaricoccus sp. TaxID=1872485 RepID=UPI0039E35AEA
MPNGGRIGMQGWKRRAVYVVAYETIAIVVTAVGVAALYRVGPMHAGGLSVLSSAIAMAWNLVYNMAFEAWEARRAVAGRTFRWRVAHAVGFEGGLALILVPVVAWWMEIGIAEALVLDLGLLAFFLVYTFAFNLAFDRIFGLPASAAGKPS